MCYFLPLSFVPFKILNFSPLDCFQLSVSVSAGQNLPPSLRLRQRVLQSVTQLQVQSSKLLGSPGPGHIRDSASARSLCNHNKTFSLDLTFGTPCPGYQFNLWTVGGGLRWVYHQMKTTIPQLGLWSPKNINIFHYNCLHFLPDYYSKCWTCVQIHWLYGEGHTAELKLEEHLL